MENIYSYALKMAWANDSINFAVFNMLVNELDDDIRKRFVEAVIGIVNPDDIRKSIPVVSKMGNYEAYWESYNYLTNTVKYTYHYDDVRYFKTEEDAQKYNETGEYNWSKMSSRKDDEYPFEGTWGRIANSSTSLEDWLLHKISD